MSLILTLIVLAIVAAVVSYITVPPVFKNVAYLILGIVMLVVLLRALGFAL